MVEKHELPYQFRNNDRTIVTVEFPTKGLNEVLKNGVERVPWPTIRDLGTAIKYETAPITVRSASPEHFTVAVKNDDGWHRYFFVSNERILFDLAKVIEDATGLDVKK